MSKTIEEQVEEFVVKSNNIVAEGGFAGKFGLAEKHATDWLRKALQERDRIAREQAIKECEGCVPEEKDIPPREDVFGIEPEFERGHNSCREQTLQAISKLRVCL